MNSVTPVPQRKCQVKFKVVGVGCDYLPRLPALNTTLHSDSSVLG